MGGKEGTEYRGAKEKRRLSRGEGRLAIGGDGGWTMGGSGMMARSSLGVPILQRGRRDHAVEVLGKYSVGVRSGHRED